MALLTQSHELMTLPGREGVRMDSSCFGLETFHPGHIVIVMFVAMWIATEPMSQPLFPSPSPCPVTSKGTVNEQSDFARLGGLKPLKRFLALFRGSGSTLLVSEAQSEACWSCLDHLLTLFNVLCPGEPEKFK